MNEHLHHTPEHKDNDRSGEKVLPGEGSLVFLSVGHGAFGKEKFPQIVDVASGDTLGDAAPYEGTTKAEGGYGPTGEDAEGVALTVPGRHTEKGVQEMQAAGLDIATMLNDGVRTKVIVVASPATWPNEEMMGSNVPHEYGAYSSRTIEAAGIMKDTLQAAADSDPDLQLDIDPQLLTDERISEAPFNYSPNAASKSEAAGISAAAKKVAIDSGYEKGSKEAGEEARKAYLRGDAEVDQAVEALSEQTAADIAAGIEEMHKEWYERKDVQELLDAGVRVVVVEATSKLTKLSTAYHTLGNEGLDTGAPGYGNAQVVATEYTPGENTNNHRLLGTA